MRLGTRYMLVIYTIGAGPTTVVNIAFYKQFIHFFHFLCF